MEQKLCYGRLAGTVWLISYVMCLQLRQQQQPVRCAIKVLHFRKSILTAAVQTHLTSEANMENVASLVLLRYYTV